VKGVEPLKNGTVFLRWKRFLVTAAIILLVAFFLVPLAAKQSASLPEAAAFMALPFLACFVITGIHTYLGVHVIARGVIFVDLCLAQIAALGALYAVLLGFPTGSRSAYAVSLLFTFIGAAVFAFGRFGEKRIPLEAIIGITYAVATAVSLLILSRAPHEAEHIRDILTGSILWVDGETVIRTAKIYGVIGIFHAALFPVFTRLSFKTGARQPGATLWDFLFYMSFGIVITLSVAIAGVLLVFSFLVIPVVMAMLFTVKLSVTLWAGWAVGTAVSVASLVASYVFDLPSGPCVVTFFGLSVLLLATGKGVFNLVGGRPRPAGNGGQTDG
jgi:zinc/manganese transport system permease protein